MAKLTGLLQLQGTIGAITFYQVGGKTIAKQRNRAPAKSRYKNHASYTNVRRNADWFSEAQRFASSVYRTLPPAEKDQKQLWYPLRNKAQELVRQELDHAEIIAALERELTRLREDKKRRKEYAKPAAAVSPVLQMPAARGSENEKGSGPDEILLGRYYARTDNLSLASELHAFNTIMRQLLHADNRTEDAMASSQRNGLKATRKLRW